MLRFVYVNLNCFYIMSLLLAWGAKTFLLFLPFLVSSLLYFSIILNFFFRSLWFFFCAGHEETVWWKKVQTSVITLMCCIIYLDLFLLWLMDLQRIIWSIDQKVYREGKSKRSQRGVFFFSPTASGLWWIWWGSKCLCIAYEVPPTRTIPQSSNSSC